MPDAGHKSPGPKPTDPASKNPASKNPAPQASAPQASAPQASAPQASASQASASSNPPPSDPPPRDALAFRMPDPAVTSRSMTDIAERSQRLVTDWLNRQSVDAPEIDPMNVGSAFLEMTGRLMSNPGRLMRAQVGLWQDYMTLWQNTTRRIWGMEEAKPVIQPDPRDRRFKDEAWRESEVFDFIKQSYLLSARYVHDVVGHVEGLDRKTAQKVDFYARQFTDALSPSNFLLTNPEVLRKTAETGGQNLMRGLSNLLRDLERGRGRLSVKMTDTEAFKLGDNIGTTPGQVVYQNDLMQLIQYNPSTPNVLRRPLLVLPPWINKYYILDLRPANSLVKYLVAQGHTVFVVSWVNPDEHLAEKGFDDYQTEGIHDALDAIERATGEREINAVGYCLGGTLLASTLATMARTGDDRIRSATFLVTMMDFAEAGELAVFIDEEQISNMEEKMKRRGYLEGSEMAQTFNMLRSNDLIWSFVVNNYLMGNEPFPFDLLYWNSDATRMPARMHSFYLRNMYQANKLKDPDGISLNGVPVDLGRVQVPSYFLSTREDHIAPWRSTYRGTQLLRGANRFVLAASGHIAGVVNPPGGGKYSHWINSDLPTEPEEWLKNATEMAGSWWPDWHRWASNLAPETVPARTPGDRSLTPIEPAPGKYVTVQA